MKFCLYLGQMLHLIFTCINASCDTQTKYKQAFVAQVKFGITDAELNITLGLILSHKPLNLISQVCILVFLGLNNMTF